MKLLKTTKNYYLILVDTNYYLYDCNGIRYAQVFIDGLYIKPRNENSNLNISLDEIEEFKKIILYVAKLVSKENTKDL